MRYITKHGKKVIGIAFLLIVFVGGGSCLGRKQEAFKGFEIPGVPPGYFEKWEYFTVDSEVVKEKAKEFFGGREYKAIWKWDTDGDGKIEYLLIEPHPEIVKGIKSGILIGEDGEVKLIIDRDKGFYTPEYMVEDFERKGIKKGEVGCIRLLYHKNDGRGNSMVFTKKDREKLKKRRIMTELGIMWYERMDKDLKLFPPGEIWIEKYYNPNKDRVEYMVYDFMYIPEEKVYENARKAIKNYRINKSKGIVFDPVNFDPENPEEVKKYIQSLKEKK